MSKPASMLQLRWVTGQLWRSCQGLARLAPGLVTAISKASRLSGCSLRKRTMGSISATPQGVHSINGPTAEVVDICPDMSNLKEMRKVVSLLQCEAKPNVTTSLLLMMSRWTHCPRRFQLHSQVCKAIEVSQTQTAPAGEQLPNNPGSYQFSDSDCSIVSCGKIVSSERLRSGCITSSVRQCASCVIWCIPAAAADTTVSE